VIAEPVALVVAHADDETLFAGALLRRLVQGRLIHVTDGAPRDMADATRLGLATREAYAAVRARELDAAVAILGGDPARREYRTADQEAVQHLAQIADRLTEDLRGAAVVATHAYEGGHPDHDAVALAVAVACERLGDAAPARVEFASYHLLDGERVWARFWPDPDAPEHVRALDGEDLRRIDAALAAHASQAAVFDDWRPEVERWRAAPRYDFAVPPPPGECLYDRFGWALTSERWRALATGVFA
jgi:LmbE family N-acetylglucosaminyl deacetylase